MSEQSDRDPAQAEKADSLSALFTRRMIEEQEIRGWTDAGLAHRASAHHPITANTIWQIRKRGRRVDVDEADAIARALGYFHVREFVQSTPEYTAFQGAFLPLLRELGQLAFSSADPEHPLNVIEGLDAQMNHVRTESKWREIRHSPNYRIDSLGNPMVMVQELREVLPLAIARVNQVLNNLGSDLEATEERLTEAGERVEK